VIVECNVVIPDNKSILKGLQNIWGTAISKEMASLFLVSLRSPEKLNFMIRNVTPSDASEICEIYNHYVKNTMITFEKDEVSSNDMKSRICSITAKLPWIVFLEEGKIIAYAYASEWKSRCAYKYSVETTVYLESNATGKGIGTKLYQELIGRLTKLDIHVAIGGIALPNDSSIALHEKFSFEKTAHFKEVGYKFNKWVDVGYWQLIFN